MEYQEKNSRKFNFKYASEVSTTFLRTYRVVSRPLKILFNHSVIDQKDKETFRHMLSTLCHMTMIEGAREEKTLRFSIWEEQMAYCICTKVLQDKKLADPYAKNAERQQSKSRKRYRLAGSPAVSLHQLFLATQA